jgi:hypothetical protein
MMNSWPRRRRAGILTYTVLAAIVAVNGASFMGVINSRPTRLRQLPRWLRTAGHQTPA